MNIKILMKNVSKRFSSKNEKESSVLQDLARLSICIEDVIRECAIDLTPTQVIELCRLVAYDANIKMSANDTEKLKWVLGLIKKLTYEKAPRIPRSNWPVPIIYRINKIFKNASLPDYVLLYECLIHFHFAVSASLFLQISNDIEQFLYTSDKFQETSLSNNLALGNKILHLTLKDAHCMGGRTWLQRAAGLAYAGSAILHEYNNAEKYSFREIFQILEPESLTLHKKFGNGVHESEIIKEGGATYGVFCLMQKVRNILYGHGDKDITGPIPQETLDGLSILLGVMCDLLSPYRGLSVALVHEHNKKIREISMQWAVSDGAEISPHNPESRRELISIWGNPENSGGPIIAPQCPEILGWSWHDSLLLFDHNESGKRYLYLMPMGCRDYQDNSTGKILAGLLYQVKWRSTKSNNISVNLEQRRYIDTSELQENDGENCNPASPNTGQICENIKILAEHIENKYNLKSDNNETLPDCFVDSDRYFYLNHSEIAKDICKKTIFREEEANRILGLANERKHNACGATKLLLVGPSGVGKSVLMAQMYNLVSDQAIYFTMDHAPEPEFEIAPSFFKSKTNNAFFAHSESATSESIAADSLHKPHISELDAIQEKSFETTNGKASSFAQSPYISDAKYERSLGVSMRMHWVASVCRLLNKPEPQTLLTALEAQRKISTMLLELLKRSPNRIIYIFVDAINQTETPDLLFQGLKPFSSLPSNTVIIASSQDIEYVIYDISDGNKIAWEKCIVNPPSVEVIKKIMLMDMPANQRPILSNNFLNFIEKKSKGLPFLLRHWADLFREISSQKISYDAEQKMINIINKSDAGLFPKEYFSRLRLICEHFIPSSLPLALMWCLSMAYRPLNLKQLAQSVEILRDFIHALPVVSNVSIEKALNKLGGYIDVSKSRTELQWRLAHPLIGEAWLDYIGNENDITHINQALLFLPVAPKIKYWKPSDYCAWIKNVLDFDARYLDLENEQQIHIIDGLLEYIEQPNCKYGNRFAALIANKSWLLINSNHYAQAYAISWSALRRSELLINTLRPSSELTNVLLWDQSMIFEVLGKVDWDKNIADARMPTYQKVLSLRLMCNDSLRIDTNTKKLKLCTAYTNIALVLGNYSQYNEAINYINNAENSLSGLDVDKLILCEKVAYTANIKAWILHCNNNIEGAIKECSIAISNYKIIASHKPRHALSLADAYMRASYCYSDKGLYELAIYYQQKAMDAFIDIDMNTSDHRAQASEYLNQSGYIYYNAKDYEGAIKKYSDAINLLFHIDRNNPKYLDKLSQYIYNRGCAYKEIGDLKNSINDFSEASTMYKSLIGEDASKPIKSEYVKKLADSMFNLARVLEKSEGLLNAIEVYKDIVFNLAGSCNLPNNSDIVIDSKIALFSLLRKTNNKQILLSILSNENDESVLYKLKELGPIFNCTTPENTKELALFSDRLGPNFIFKNISRKNMDWLLDQCGIDLDLFPEIRQRVIAKRAKLSFYHDTYLVSIIDPYKTGRREIFALTKFCSQVRILDWTNQPIYMTNNDWGIDLSDRRKVLSYLYFFFGLVRGRHGRFIMVDNVQDINWAQNRNDNELRQANELIAPPKRATDTADSQTCEFILTLLFRDSLFKANAKVQCIASKLDKAGRVYLGEEKLLIENLNIIEDFPPWIINKHNDDQLETKADSNDINENKIHYKARDLPNIFKCSSWVRDVVEKSEQSLAYLEKIRTLIFAEPDAMSLEQHVVLAGITHNQGIINYRNFQAHLAANDFINSAKMYMKANTLSESGDYLFEYAVTTFCCGCAHEAIGEFEKALSNYKNAKNCFLLSDCYAKFDMDSHVISDCDFYSAYCHEALNDYQSALEVYEHLIAESLFAEPSDIRNQRLALYKIAKVKLLKTTNRIDILIQSLLTETDVKVFFSTKEIGSFFYKNDVDKKMLGTVQKLTRLTSDGMISFAAIPSNSAEYTCWLLETCGFCYSDFSKIRERIIIKYFSIPFYNNSYLSAFISQSNESNDDAIEVFAISSFKDNEKLYILDWSREQIYHINNVMGIFFENEQMVKDYLRFIFQLSLTNGVKRIILENKHDSYLPFTASEYKDVQLDKIAPIECLNFDSGVSAEFKICFSTNNNVVLSVVSICLDTESKYFGTVEIQNEEVIIN